ncbi:aldose 1-epimerase family protein [Sphingobium boeckii]|uniref:Galactose mutarotase-like enzyme n=1 Tax=Sphingobium boeckii TaxID=1082345 RepID=A0A7W9AE91_9SPHN|nr:galactose mutarotase-like enzyme [Sphingobium boeckii]
MDELESVIITSNGLTAKIARLGAELVSLRDPQHRELMSDGDPAYWTGRAPILFPIVGRLDGDRYTLDGDRYALPQHGFARRTEFAIAEQGESHVRLRLTDSPVTRVAYPFAFVLEMDFLLDGATLTMAATIRNPGLVPLPASFGYHPAFAWPLPYEAARTGHRIVFEADEAADILAITSDGLIDGKRPSPVEGDTLRLSDDLFAHGALIWNTLDSRSLRYGPPAGPALEMDFPDTEWLGVWTKPGAGFVCIEPWAGMADTLGYHGDFRDRPGVFEIAPGSSRTFRMTVRLAEN